MLSQSRDNNAFLAKLSPPEIAILRSHLVPFDLRVGDRLHSQGDHLENVIFPHSGLAAMTMPLRDGAAGAGVVLIGRDGIVGGLGAAAAAPAACGAEVLIRGHASRISAAAYRHILDQNVSIRRLAARFDSAMLAQAQQTALCHAAHPVEARICRWLLEVQDRSGDSMVPLTQNTLGQMLGVRRTTVTLVAGRLEAVGVLKCHRGYVQIISQSELERRSCQCYSHVKSYLARLFTGRDQTVTADQPRERAGRRAVESIPGRPVSRTIPG